MAQYGTQSSTLLNTVDTELSILFNEVIKKFDNKILYGHRTPVEQFELFKLGRTNINGDWVIVDKSKVVTYKDGIHTLSNHNYTPSRAIDAAPFPINWKDLPRIYLFAGYVLGTANLLFTNGIITKRIRWGGDWNQNTIISDETFLDLVHFEVII